MNNIQQILGKLRVIGELKVNQKLYFSGDRVGIYGDTWLDWTKRKLAGETKSTQRDALRDLFRYMQCVAENLMYSIQHSSSADHRAALITEAIELRSCLQMACIGLQNLSTTYKKFPDVATEINGIRLDHAERIVNALNTVLKIRPDAVNDADDFSH